MCTVERGRLGGSNPTHDKSPTWTMCIWRLFPFSAFPQKGKLCWQVCWCRVRTQPSGEMVFRGWFCVTQPKRKKNSLPMQKYFRKRDFSAISVILHSIFQITLGRDELALVAVERDMMPGIQLIKFSFFELLSANFTRFASVHFRVLWQSQAPRQICSKTGEKFPNLLGWKWGSDGAERRNDKCDNLCGGGKGIVEKKAKCWGVSQQELITSRLKMQLILDWIWLELRRRETLRRNPKKFFSPQAQNIYEYKLKNIFALSSS